MAVINKDLSLMSFNNTFSRLSARPLDSTSIYYTLQAAQTYAQTDPYAYVGQIISVVDESNETSTAYIIVNTAGDLEEIGTGGSSTLVVQNVSDLTSTVANDLAVGQTAFVVSESRSYILTAIGATPPSTYQWTEMTSSDTAWSGTEDSVVFYALTQSQYNGIGSKDANTLYFITDSGSVYKGSQNVTKFIVPTTSIPAAASDAIVDKLYINTTTYEAKVTADGATWINLTPGYITDGGNWSETTNDSKLGTIAAIKQVITGALATINTNAQFANATGTLTVGSGTGAVLTGVAHDPEWDAGQLTLTIPVYGQDAITVNIPKDKFVTAGQYYAQYPEEEPEYYNVIVLTIENQVEPVIIPAEALVQVYTANNTGKNVTVTVDNEENTISASITIDPAAGNALKHSDSGFMVDISGKMNTYGAGNASEVVISDAAGNVISRSGLTLLSDPDNNASLGTSQTQVPVASIIARAIATAVNAAQTTLQQAIDGKLNKLTGEAGDAGKIVVVGADGTTVDIGTVTIADLATAASVANKVDKVVGTVDDLVTFAAEGAIKDSGKKIGGATLAGTPNANTVATEAAVSDAISWKTLS